MWLWTERDLALYAVVGLFLLEVYVAQLHRDMDQTQERTSYQVSVRNCRVKTGF